MPCYNKNALSTFEVVKTTKLFTKRCNACYVVATDEYCTSTVDATCTCIVLIHRADTRANLSIVIAYSTSSLTRYSVTVR